LRYVADRTYQVGESLLPAGTVTVAVYWRDRPYHLWRFILPDGRILGHRCDLSTYPRFRPQAQELEWRDLVLDLWWPQGAPGPYVLDGEEFQEARRWLPFSQVALAERILAFLQRHLPQVLEAAFQERSEGCFG